MSAAETIRCGACDGDIPLRTLAAAAELRCPYCQAEQRLDPERLAQLQRYRQNVDVISEQAVASSAQAAGWEAMAASTASPRSLIVLLALILVVPLLFAVVEAIGGFAVGSALHRILGGASMVVMVGGLLVFLALSVRRYKQRSGVKQPFVAGIARPGCPSCGALNELRAGEALGSCSFCGAALVPTTAMQQQGVAVARDAAHEAELQRYRAERRGMARLQSSSRKVGPYLFLSSWLLMIGGAGIVFTIDQIKQGKPFALPLLSCLGMMVVIVGSVLLYLWVRRRRQRRWLAALSTLAAQFRGDPFAGLDGLVRWLDDNWPASYEMADLVAGVLPCGTSLSLGGTPALLYCDAVSGSNEDHVPKVQLLVATGADREVADGAEELLGEKRFAVQRSRAGLLGRAAEPWTRQIARKPERLGELAPLLDQLCRQ